MFQKASEQANEPVMIRIWKRSLIATPANCWEKMMLALAHGLDRFALHTAQKEWSRTSAARVPMQFLEGKTLPGVAALDDA